MRRSILLGSRVAAGALCVASSAVMAAPVNADPSPSDRNTVYLRTLQLFGLYLSRDDAFAQGVAVCLVSDEPGKTLADVVTQVVAMHPTWTRIDAQHFVGAAEERYCPGKLPGGAQRPVCGPEETPAASFGAVDLRVGNGRPRTDTALRDYDIAGGLVGRPVEPALDPTDQRHAQTVEQPALLRDPRRPSADRTADPVEAMF